MATKRIKVNDSMASPDPATGVITSFMPQHDYTIDAAWADQFINAGLAVEVDEHGTPLDQLRRTRSSGKGAAE